MDLPSTSRGYFRHSEDELDKSTPRESSDYDDDDDGTRLSDIDEGASSGIGTLQSLSISSDGNKTTQTPATSVTQTPPTSSSEPSKPPPKKLRDVFPWIADVELSTKNCLGSLTDIRRFEVWNEMDILLGFVHL